MLAVGEVSVLALALAFILVPRAEADQVGHVYAGPYIGTPGNVGGRFAYMGGWDGADSEFGRGYLSLDFAWPLSKGDLKPRGQIDLWNLDCAVDFVPLGPIGLGAGIGIQHTLYGTNDGDQRPFGIGFQAFLMLQNVPAVQSALTFEWEALTVDKGGRKDITWTSSLMFGETSPALFGSVTYGRYTFASDPEKYNGFTARVGIGFGAASGF
jgi:hypothetical protein